MPLNYVVYFLLFLMAYHFYSVYSVRNKIWCSFRRADRTKVEKWAKENQARIDFDGGWYHVEPSRTVLMLKWNPLPMWVRALDFRHDSARALHPDTFDNAFTPEARKQLDKTDDIKALEIGNNQALAGGKQKKGLLESFMPIIVIGGFLIVAWFLWQQQHKIDMVGQATNIIEAQLAKILSRMP